MEVREDNSGKTELSFLINSNDVQRFLLTKEEAEIFKKMDGLKTISEISEETNLSASYIISFINKFKKINLLEIVDNKNITFDLYDRHDLFFDMSFNKKQFTKKY